MILSSNTRKTDAIIVGVPYGIGCGLGGGDWSVYSKLLKEFETRLPFSVKMIVYRP
jgi:tRNA G10  N-methylase Trm11